MVAIQVISYPSFPPSSPSKVCRIFNRVLDTSYYNMIISIIPIIQNIFLCLLTILCITLCILTYLNAKSQNLHTKKLLCNLILIIIICIAFLTSFLFEPNCN